MNGELSPGKKKGNNRGRDYNIRHFLVWELICLVSCLLNMLLEGIFAIKENYEKLSCAIEAIGMWGYLNCQVKLSTVFSFNNF